MKTKVVNKSKLRVLEVTTDDGLQVKVEGPNLTAVTSTEAKRLAIAAAAQAGYARCGVSSSTGPYIVDAEGHGATSNDAAERWQQEAAIAKAGNYCYHNVFTLLQGVGS